MAQVTAWSTKAVSFGAKGWSNNLRLALLEGLRALNASQGCLAGDVWDGRGRVRDLENALMYNIGLREFTPFLKNGLRFRRHAHAFLPERELAGGQVAAHYRYAVVEPIPGETATVGSDRVLFSFRAERPSDVKSTWLAARAAVAELEGSASLIDSRLGISVVAPRGLVAGSVKPLLDAIVSALHLVSVGDCLTLHTFARWGLKHAELLATSGAAPLGTRQLIVMQGSGRPSWNPADDVFDEIVLTTDIADDGCWVEVWRLPEGGI